MTIKKHPLHKQVAETIFRIGKANSYEVIVDKDCKFNGYLGVDQQLPFYLSFRPASESTVSMVDVMLLKDGKVKLVCEIEESGFNPTEIFGKLFSTASAKICRLKEKSKYSIYELDKDSIFVQVISSKDFSEDSKKEKQGQLIENEINHKLNLHNSWIKQYRLIYGKETDFVKPGRLGYDEIERILMSL